jgi:hypothetical protein
MTKYYKPERSSGWCPSIMSYLERIPSLGSTREGLPSLFTPDQLIKEKGVLEYVNSHNQ